MDISRSILTEEQYAFGFRLLEQEDFVVLTGGGQTLTYNSKAVTINKLREDADQIIQASKSGIVIETQRDSKPIDDGEWVENSKHWASKPESRTAEVKKE